MNADSHTTHLSLEPINNRRLADLCGPLNQYIKQLEAYFDVKIHQRSNQIHIVGNDQATNATQKVLKKMYAETKQTGLTAAKVNLLMQEVKNMSSNDATTAPHCEFSLRTQRGILRPRGRHQQDYINAMQHHAVNFGIGPAGTGKTYLAVACAVEALQSHKVQRIIFVRPAVEAGERLGFLPGDLEAKVLPYLRPLYDALYEMMGGEQVAKLIEQNIIEVAPLAFMRGRTLNDSFIILDEGQNTTIEQMKMFLTRIGFGSTAVITGDVTQIDLGKNITSGLTHAMQVLQGIPTISFTHFSAKDAVRHPLVQTIIRAYEAYTERDPE